MHMKRQKLQTIIKKHYTSKDTIKSIMCGRMKPNADLRYELEKSHKIPFSVWGKPLNSYLQGNNKTLSSDKAIINE